MILCNLYYTPQRLLEKIQALQSEDDAYAADELVELGEEILLQLAAMGFAVYLGQSKQKDVFNDFLLSLFLSKGHAYNAGPLYRWAANMIKEIGDNDAELLKPFFWDIIGSKYILNEENHHLASLRNDVMHGFFVLPPERNREEAKKIETILEKIDKVGLFKQNFGLYHFIDNNEYIGSWNIQENTSFKLLESNFEFGKLAQRISYEYSNEFKKNETEVAFIETKSIDSIKQFIKKGIEKEKGAYVCWYKPGSSDGINAYRQMIQSIDKSEYYPIYYMLHSQGATYTMNFLEQRIATALYEMTQDEKALKDPIKFLKTHKGSISKKLVIVFHDLHIALFSPNHITNLFNILYDLNICILATSWYYSYLKDFVNLSINITENQVKYSLNEIEFSIDNYLRFKGPSNDKKDEKEDYDLIKEIVNEIIHHLKAKNKVVARRFADLHNFPIEYVFEAFNILSPFYSVVKEKFIEDELDKLYDFPINNEESTLIYLSLGRRDLKLEYEHLILMPNE